MNTTHNSQDISVLHGFRVIFILLVANFHIWQQSWLMPYIRIFGKGYCFDYLARSGYIYVDGMILISALLMFLPYARHIVYQDELPSVKEYYIKRVARIAPSYYFSVFITFILFALPNNRYMGNTSNMLKDVIYHIFFINTFDYYAYFATNVNVVLWTVAILMQGYLLMPFIIRLLIKRPFIVSTIMLIIAFTYRLYASVQPNIAIYINQLPAFLDIYLFGFLLAYIISVLQKNILQYRFKLWHKIISTIAFLLSIFLISKLCESQAMSNSIQLDQLKNRFALGMLFSISIITANMSIKPLVWLLSNKLVRFLAVISYNFYIWHQFLAVEMRVAFFDTEQLHADIPLQKAYTLLCWSVALVVATFVTYFVEKPSARFIINKFTRSKK